MPKLAGVALVYKNNHLVKSLWEYGHWLADQNLRFCEFPNFVAIGYYKLWWPMIANISFETSQMLWHLATRNCGGLCLQKIVIQEVPS